ncbi:CU044_5270 family protein [Streptomyces griseoluteus]|uniref:CU044_5270 family protein n=1 Tax=Streptomyces griseoluteus TaxID=29306 RepID=UPI0036EDFEE8
MRDIDRTLRELNPVRTGREAGQARLDAILSAPRAATAAVHRPWVRPRWVWAAAAATVTAGVFAYAVVDPFGVSTQPALAVTPSPLRVQPGEAPAAGVLKEIADRVDGRPDPRAAPWTAEHFIRDDWALSSRIDNIQVTSAVITEHRETWQQPDGSARWKVDTLPPVFQNAHQREVWESAGAVGEEAQEWSGEAGPHAVVEPPATVDGMRKWLANGQNTGPGLLYEVIPERFQDHVFSPAQRAAVLRVLATTPGVVHAGTVQDRAGRTGEAFSLTGRFGGLPNKRTLVFDPATGDLLAYEEQLQHDTGKLRVRPYSVIGYSTFLKAERLP